MSSRFLKNGPGRVTSVPAQSYREILPPRNRKVSSTMRAVGGPSKVARRLMLVAFANVRKGLDITGWERELDTFRIKFN